MDIWDLWRYTVLQQIGSWSMYSVPLKKKKKKKNWISSADKREEKEEEEEEEEEEEVGNKRVRQEGRKNSMREKADIYNSPMLSDKYVKFKEGRKKEGKQVDHVTYIYILS